MKLEMQKISKEFGPVLALQNVDFQMGAGEIHGLLGENGAGKTTLMNILSGNFPPTSGKIIIDGNEITNMTPQKSMEMKIRFIHQELNLCNDLKVYENMFLGEELTNKAGVIDKKTEIQRAQEVLDGMNVKIDAMALVSDLETAKKQLVEIAKALLFQSELIIMDEPTTALDVTIQEQILNLIAELNERMGMSVLFITHDLGAMAQICHSVRVMYLGNLVEEARTEELFARPMHPYTQGLLDCIPRLDSDRSQPLRVISGVVPPLSNVPDGCRFCTRCPYADQRCMSQNPPSVEVFPGHKAKCWKYTPEQEAE